MNVHNRLKDYCRQTPGKEKFVVRIKVDRQRLILWVPEELMHLLSKYTTQASYKDITEKERKAA